MPTQPNEQLYKDGNSSDPHTLKPHTSVLDAGFLDSNMTFATLKLNPKKSPEGLAEVINQSMEATGAIIYTKDINTSTVIAVTNKFYLSGLQMSLKERVQLLENFKSANVSFFGDTAKVYQLQGVAVDYASTSKHGDEYYHQSSLLHMYENHLRGSVLVEKDQIAVLKVMNHTIEGYPISMNVVYTSTTDKTAQFSLNIVVTKHDFWADDIVPKKTIEDSYKGTHSTSVKTPEIVTDAQDLIAWINAALDLKNKQTSAKFNDAKFFEKFHSSNTNSILNNRAALLGLKKAKMQNNFEKYLGTLFEHFSRIGANIMLFNGKYKAYQLDGSFIVPPAFALGPADTAKKLIGKDQSKYDVVVTTICGALDKLSKMKNYLGIIIANANMSASGLSDIKAQPTTTLNTPIKF